jgi:hypothetical protein
VTLPGARVARPFAALRLVLKVWRSALGVASGGDTVAGDTVWSVFGAKGVIFPPTRVCGAGGVRGFEEDGLIAMRVQLSAFLARFAWCRCLGPLFRPACFLCVADALAGFGAHLSATAFRACLTVTAIARAGSTLSV